MLTLLFAPSMAHTDELPFGYLVGFAEMLGRHHFMIPFATANN
jgi:hypothetical protein